MIIQRCDFVDFQSPHQNERNGIAKGKFLIAILTANFNRCLMIRMGWVFQLHQRILPKIPDHYFAEHRISGKASMNFRKNER